MLSASNISDREGRACAPGTRGADALSTAVQRRPTRLGGEGETRRGAGGDGAVDGLTLDAVDNDYEAAFAGVP